MRAEALLAWASVMRPWWKADQVVAAWTALKEADTLQRELEELKQEIGRTPEKSKRDLLDAKRQVYERVLGINRG